MDYLDRMIATGRLEEFVDRFITLYNEEMEDKTLWEIWLHRIHDKGFDEFKKSISGKPQTAAPTPEEIKSIAMDSKDILASFVPDKGLVNGNGTVQTAGNNSG